MWLGELWEPKWFGFPPCLPCFPRISVPTIFPTWGRLHARRGMSSSELRALCFARLQIGGRSHCSSLLLTTLESPHPWGAEVRYAAWLAMGRPRNRVRRPEEQSKASLPNSHLGTSSRRLVHPIYRRSVYWVLGLTRHTRHTAQSVLKDRWILYKWVTKKHPEPWMNHVIVQYLEYVLGMQLDTRLCRTDRALDQQPVVLFTWVYSDEAVFGPWRNNSITRAWAQGEGRQALGIKESKTVNKELSAKIPGSSVSL